MSESPVFFSEIDRILEVAGLALLFYLLIVVVVRIQGKRTTSQLNNFDWIVNVTVGSLAASGILLRDIPFSDSAIAIIMLGVAQWMVTWGASRFEWFGNLVRARPRMLLHKGEMLREEMRKERISESEIRSKLRQQGACSIADANWVTLESDGTLSLIPRDETALKECGLMTDVDGGPDARRGANP